MAKDLSDAELLARALARWEGEGGALAPSETGPLGDLDLRILARIGAAVLNLWHDLPTGLQRAIFERASTLDAAGDADRVKAELARFLHDHKDH